MHESYISLAYCRVLPLKFVKHPWPSSYFSLFFLSLSSPSLSLSQFSFCHRNGFLQIGFLSLRVGFEAILFCWFWYVGSCLLLVRICSSLLLVQIGFMLKWILLLLSWIGFFFQFFQLLMWCDSWSIQSVYKLGFMWSFVFFPPHIFCKILVSFSIYSVFGTGIWAKLV